jgi:Xaa-Pro aminopeptidase
MEDSMKERVAIPVEEYKTRVAKAAEMVREKNLDALIVNSTEADFANVRYFSRFWPLFETAGVVITGSGDCALLVGPESGEFAEDVSVIDDIFIMKEYRESADPSYPELTTSSFRDVFKKMGITGENLVIGIGGYLVTNPIQLEGIRESFPQAEIVRADDIMIALRSIKSENEIACLKEGCRIVEIATREVIEHIKPGMTELQLVGIAEKSIYENGAEYEGLPMYIFSEKSTRHAISRPSYRTIGKGDLVQLNLSARVDGYSPSIGMPISMGPLQGEKRDYVEFCLDAHRWTQSRLKAGLTASTVAKEFYDLYKEKGYEKNYVYGPCHGLGMIEVEPPWMETDSEYTLNESMTFQVDTFIATERFGIRWETGVKIVEDGIEPLSNPLGKIYELDV